MSRAPVFVERVPAPEFAELFLAGGVLGDLVDVVRESDGLLDLDFWGDSRAKMERASLYCGLAKLADVYIGRGQQLRLEVAGLVRRRLKLPHEPARWLPAGRHPELAGQLMSVIDRAVPVLPESHIRAGRTLRAASGRTVLARNFGPRFDEDKTGASWLSGATEPVREVLRAVDAIPPNLPPKPVCDALMIDPAGGLLLVEAETPRSPEIGFAPARAAQQLALWDAWVEADRSALSHLRHIAEVREMLGLCPAGTAGLLADSGTPRSTYLLATEASASPALLERMDEAAALLEAADLLDATRFRCELTPAPDTVVAAASWLRRDRLDIGQVI